MDSVVVQRSPFRLAFASLALTGAMLAGACSPAASAPGATQAPAQPAAGQPSTALSGEPIKIGAIFPLSGPNALTGQDTLDAQKLVIEQANAAGGIQGRPIEIIALDDRSTPSEGVSAAQKLLNDDKVVAILGAYNSNVCAAIQDVIERAQVPELVSGCTADELTQKGLKYFFRPGMSNQIQAESFIHQVIQQMGKKRLAVLYENSDWGNGLDQLTNKIARDDGAEIVVQEGYNPGASDFRSSLAKIKAAQPDAIIAPNLVNEAGIIARQAKELNLPGSMFFGFGGWTTDDLHRVAAGSEEGVTFAEVYQVGSPTTQAFDKAFTARYNRGTNVFSAQGWTAATVLVDALKRAEDLTGPKIRDAVAATRDLPTPVGNISFDATGQATGVGVTPMKWVGGKRVPLSS